MELKVSGVTKKRICPRKAEMRPEGIQGRVWWNMGLNRAVGGKDRPRIATTWLLVASLGAVCASCETSPQPAWAVESHLIPAEVVCKAIYQAEGGKKAKVAYGVLSVPVANEAEARQVCLNSIRNSRQRWIRAGRPGDWLDFMAARWIPESVDPVGHRNWLKNVRYFLDK